MKHAKTKRNRNRKRSGPQKQVNQDVSCSGGEEAAAAEENDEESKVLSSLMEAFSLISLEEAASAYREANRDPNKAADILGLRSKNSKSLTASTSGSSGSGSSSSEELNVKEYGGNKAKKVIAATGTISSLLGKDYVMKSTKKDSMMSKGLRNVHVDKEEAEQFLCSMLGDECELSMAVVRDVLCHCGYNVEQALDALLDLASSFREQSCNNRFSRPSSNDNEETGFLIDYSSNFTDMGSDSASQSSENDLQDSVRSMDKGIRSYFKVLATSDVHSTTSERVSESDLPQAVLESLFNVSKSSVHDPSTMNWRNVIKKFESLGQRLDSCHSHTNQIQRNNPDRGDEYQAFRKTATPHWDSMRSCYQRAATAYCRGERGYAAYLSEQGKLHTKMAREADEKASQQIFKARNKSIENVVTIDLHGQHVKQALKLLKLHLLFGTYVSSIQILRVITGCGSRGAGKSKLKESVIKLVENEGIAWSEENRGTVLIKLDGQREFSFLDFDSETE